MKKILFIIDKIELKYFEYNTLVTNFWLIKEFLDRNNEVFITTLPQLSLVGSSPITLCYESYTQNNNIFYKDILVERNINEFDLVFFRPDPPVDINYINATYVFDFVTTKVINSPRSIRSFNEKLHSLYFQEFMPESLVTANLKNIELFLKKHNELVIKPLNQCFGSGVMILKENDPNFRTIVKNITNNESTMVMVQKLIPEVKYGDIRVLTLGDKILPYCVKKLPGNGDFKFNNHSDAFLVDAELSKETLSYFSPIAKKLYSLGIEMAGLDVIGNKVIEINVTSPCYFIKEINRIYNIRLEKQLGDYLLTTNLLSL